MYSGLTNQLIRLVKSFPRASGTFFMVAGSFASASGLSEGRALEPFRGGLEVQGHVKAVVDTSGWRPQYSADIVVKLGEAEPVIQRVPISHKEAKALGDGSAMPLVQARDGSPSFVRARDLNAASLVDVAGRPVTFTFFLGLMFLSFGLWLFLAGPSRFTERQPSPAALAQRRPLGSNPPPRPAQGTRSRL